MTTPLGPTPDMPRFTRRAQWRLLLGAVAVGGVLLQAGCAATRVARSVAMARESEPLQRPIDNPTARLLIVGDSTAVGTGASSPVTSLAGWLARSDPGLHIENRARDGATFADLPAQLQGDGRFDAVLIHAGGNDVIRLRDLDAVAADIDRATRLALQRADLVVLMPAGNVGNAPFFFAPLSWWMTARSRRLHAAVRDAAARHGAIYVNLFKERADDPFAQRRELNASDGLHPSDAGYRVWFDELTAQSRLGERLAQAADGRVPAAPRASVEPTAAGAARAPATTSP